MPRKLPARQSNLPIVVVAGGAGFLGSHLCESLLQSGVRVIALDNLVTGSLRNVAAIKRHPNFELIECNINQSLPSSLYEKKISHIIHAAGVETHGESSGATMAMAITGAFGTKNLLDLAVSTGSSFLLVSSVNVYDGLASSTSLKYYFGSSPEQEARFSHYEAKRYAEGLCQLYARDYNLDARIARVTHLYGPRMDLRTPELLSQLINMTVAGQDLNVDADGSTDLSLLYVSDAVFGISRLMFAQGESFKGSIYAFANPEKVSVISVAYTLRDFLPAGKEVAFLPADKEPHFAVPQIPLERTKRDLDWEPLVKISEGLKLTVESFKKVPPDLDAHDVTKEDLQTSGGQKDTFPEPAKSVPVPEAGNPAPGLRFRGAKSSDESVTPADSQPTSVVAAAKPTKPPPDESAPKKRSSGRRNIPRWWRRLLLGAVAVTLYAGVMRPAVHTTAYAVAGGVAMQRGVSQSKHLELTKAERSFALAGSHWLRANQALSRLDGLASMLGQKNTVTEAHNMMLGAAQTSDGLVTLTKGAAPILEQVKQIAHFAKPRSSDSFAAAMREASATISQARAQFLAARDRITTPSDAKVAGARWPDSGNTEGWIGGKIGEARKLLNQLVSGLESAERFMAVLPDAMGSNGERRYLVMLQNSNELRPTGGFLGSYALVTTKNGRIADLKIDDIYNPAGQLKKDDLEPSPKPFEKAFGIKLWGLIDANWWADAPRSSERVAKLYSDATGTSVDGVIFVTTQAMKSIMAAAGPMKLSGYDEVVSADNFIELAQMYSDVGFKPGSTAKADFLGALTNQLINRFQAADSTVLMRGGRAAATGLAEKEITMWSRSAPLMSALETQGWSGKMLETEGDYLRVVDANLAGNKSNYYVKRHTDYAVNVDRNSSLNGDVTVTWEHSGTSATWPGGDYLNFVRIYVPAGSTIRSSTGFEKDSFSVSKDGDKTVFQGFVRVPYGSKKSVNVRYLLPDSLRLPKRNNHYDLTWQKQAGIVQEPLTVRFNTPIFLSSQSVSSGGTVGGDGEIVWKGTHPGNARFSATLGSRLGT